MTAEVAIREGGQLAVAESGMNPTVSGLVAWAESARAAHGIAISLVATSFVPAAFKDKPGEATAAILAGAEVGLSPMAALRAFDVIQGVAAPRAITQRAIVQSQGHDVWVVESTDDKAIVDGQRRGSEKVQRSVWTIQRASKLGLTSKANWKNQPGAMLLARASAECCRLVASDAILGLPYSSEELWDSDDTPAPTTTTRRTAKRAAKPEMPEPSFEPDAAPEMPAEPEPEGSGEEPPIEGEIEPDEPATRAQVTKLNIQFQEWGYDERESKLAFLSERTGREITSSNDLTKAEASTLIDSFEAGQS